MRWLGAAVFWAAGCWTATPSLKPPPHPEEYLVPPTDEARWSAPLEYPKGSLFKDTIKKKVDQQNGDPFNSQPGPGFGSGPGTRGY
jgi:hypothetical protein